MTGTILDEIINAKRIRIEESKRKTNLDTLKTRCNGRERIASNRFYEALADTSRLNIIAEFKRASPSKGVISGRDPNDTALAYQTGGAAAISVLTEEDFFDGSLDDICAVRSAVEIPVLRKDFIVDAYQIYESAASGADAILLIVAALSQRDLIELHSLAQSVGLDILVEVHDRNELDSAIEIDAKLIGVNNRNLKTFEVNIDVSRDLIRSKPAGALMIAESGLQTSAELNELRELGFSGFLIGETFMRSGDPEKVLREFSGHGHR
ncbi:indole-3-glycerol phosphate synthase TrpC [soil metagenome]